jgi:hypothetical protein
MVLGYCNIVRISRSYFNTKDVFDWKFLFANIAKKRKLSILFLVPLENKQSNMRCENENNQIFLISCVPSLG